MNGKTRWLNYWWQALLDLIYSEPPGCTLCRRPVFNGAGDKIPGVFCADCWSGISIQPDGLTPCSRCSRYYNPDRQLKFSLCPECAADPPPFKNAHSVGPYTGPLREAVHQFKYRGKVKLAQPLGYLLARGVEPLVREAAENDGLLVVPVPLHQRRLAVRGFNQAQLLAEVVAVELNRRLPVGRFRPVQHCPDLLERTVETPPQTGLKRHQRLVNLAGAFRVASGFKEVVEGRPVLLIDDILTTGSTSGECARALLEAGSGNIRLGVLGAGVTS